MAHALVIGGTRNLGPDVVAALLARGDRVGVLNRGITPDDLPGDVERLRADRSGSAALASVLRGRSFDTVIDTTLYNGPDAAAIIGILEGRVGRYLAWSTGQVYLVRTGVRPPFGEADYEGPLMDEPPAGAAVDHENWAYGIGKRDAEDALHAAFAERAFPYVSLRMPMINSARDHYGRLASYVRRIEAGEPVLVPDDQPGLQLRHVFGDDVVAATMRSTGADVPSGTCVNVSPDETYDLETILGRIAALLHRDVRVVRTPRAELEARGLLPECSPWSGRWMSVLDNALSRKLGITYTPSRVWLPSLVGKR